MTDKTSSQSAIKRYEEAYARSGAIRELGNLIKVMALIVSAFFAIVALSVTHGGPDTFISLLLTSFIGIIGYGVGALVGAQSHIFRATLDSAVNTSPFLTDHERAIAMSLEPKRAWSTIDLGSVVATPAPLRAADATASTWKPEDHTFGTVSPLAMLFDEVGSAKVGSADDRSGADMPRRRSARPVRRRWH